MKNILFILIAIFYTASTFAQLSGDFTMSFLDYGKDLPPKLTSANSIVIVSVIEQVPNNSKPVDFTEICTNLHKDLKEAGINAAAFYNTDGFTGFDSKNAFMNELNKHEVKNIITCNYLTMLLQGEAVSRWVLTAFEYNGKETLFDHNQKAYKKQHKSYEGVINSFTKAVSKAKLAKSQLQYSEEPNIIFSPNVTQGDVFSYIPEDLKDKTLLIPRFEEIKLPDEPPSGMTQKATYKNLQKSNEQVAVNNRKQDELMAQYPYKYKFINFYSEYAEYQDRDDVYLLVSFVGTESMRKLIYDPEKIWRDKGVGNNDGKWGYKTTSKPQIYYYIRNGKTKAVYFGDWEGADNWEQGMKKFLSMIKE